MALIVEERLPIDLSLRFALFGLECALGVSFSGAECERVFSDAAEDQLSAKRYTFFESPCLAVTGRVDEYEPDSVRVTIRGARGGSELLRRVTDGAKLQVFRLGRSAAAPEQGE